VLVSVRPMLTMPGSSLVSKQTSCCTALWHCVCVFMAACTFISCRLIVADVIVIAIWLTNVVAADA